MTTNHKLRPCPLCGITEDNFDTYYGSSILVSPLEGIRKTPKPWDDVSLVVCIRSILCLNCFFRADFGTEDKAELYARWNALPRRYDHA